MRRAANAGGFDPIANGHLWMVEHGSQLFDELVVANGPNPVVVIRGAVCGG